MIQALPLAKSKKEWFYIILTLFVIFLLNIINHYNSYATFISEEIHTDKNLILNIYKKNNYNVLKLQNDNYTYYTSTKKNTFNKLETISATVITKDIDFISYLKGFYANTFNVNKITHENMAQTKQYLIKYIDSQHENTDISQIFQALFLAITLDKPLQEKMASFGISHLIAISGFHLGVLSFILYWFIYLFYNLIHKNYFPYRNIRFDILLITVAVLFSYLYLLGNVPSLLRSFVMFVMALFFLRTNIKLFSFYTLLFVFLLIIAFFPKLIFSLALWFSISGVFYIYLFIQYFSKLNKYISFLLFNIWLFLAMNPISHYFFEITSIEQLYSPILTLLFTLFYPLELFLHFIKYGYLLDEYIAWFLNIDIQSINYSLSLEFFILYILLSLLSIKSKLAFILLNMLFVSFNIYLYLQTIN